WRRGERIVIEANERYHGGRPALNRLIFRIIPDAVVLLQELRAGGVDFMESPPLTEVARLKQTPGLRVLVADTTSYASLGWRHDVANQTVNDTAVIVQEYLKRVGVDARLEPLDWPTFVKKLFASEFEAIVVNWTNHHDPDPFAYTIWHSSQWKGRNFGHYKNPRVDELLEQARRTGVVAERKKAYAEFSRVLMEDAPYVFLY